MTTLSFSVRAFSDIDRFSDSLEEQEGAASTLRIIVSAVEVLRRHPYIGRPIGRGLRELVISRGRTGYLALYEFHPARDEILIHKLRHQREVGYIAD